MHGSLSPEAGGIQKSAQVYDMCYEKQKRVSFIVYRSFFDVRIL